MPEPPETYNLDSETESEEASLEAGTSIHNDHRGLSSTTYFWIGPPQHKGSATCVTALAVEPSRKGCESVIFY
jgi:hypothetical protein